MRPRLRRIALSVALLSVLAGCPGRSGGCSCRSAGAPGASSSAGNPAAPPAALDLSRLRSRDVLESPKTFAVEPAGAEIRYEGARIALPPGAVERPVNVKVATVSNPGGFMVADAVPLSPVYRVEVPGAMKKGASVTLAYDAAKLPAGAEAADVRVYWSGRGEWIPLASKVDAAAATVTAEVPHFSDTRAGWEPRALVPTETPQEYATRHPDRAAWTPAVARTSSDPTGTVTVHYAVTGDNQYHGMAIGRDRTDADGNGIPEYADRILKAVLKARAVYAGLGFAQPERVDVYIRSGLKEDGYVHKFTGTFYMSGDIADDAGIDCTAAHEYFHVVQRQYATGATWAIWHYWLAEATAFWAETAVFPEHARARAATYNDAFLYINLVSPLTDPAYGTFAPSPGAVDVSSEIMNAGAPFFIFMEARQRGFTRRVLEALRDRGGNDMDLVNSVVDANSVIAAWAARYFYHQDLPGWSRDDFQAPPRSLVPKEHLLTLTAAEPVRVHEGRVHALASLPFYLFARDGDDSPPFSGTLVIRALGDAAGLVLQVFPEKNGRPLAYGERGTPAAQPSHVPDPAAAGWSRPNFGSFRASGAGCDSAAFLVTRTGTPWTDGPARIAAYVLDTPAGGRWDVAEKDGRRMYRLSWPRTPLADHPAAGPLLRDFRVFRRTPDQGFGNTPIGTVPATAPDPSFLDTASNGEDPVIYGVQLADDAGHASPIREIPVRLLDLTPLKLTAAEAGFPESPDAPGFEKGGFRQLFSPRPIAQTPNDILQYMLADGRALKRYDPTYSEAKLAEQLEKLREEVGKTTDPEGDVREISPATDARGGFRLVVIRGTDSVKLEGEPKFTYMHGVSAVFWSEKLGITGGLTMASTGKYETGLTEIEPRRWVFKTREAPAMSLEECERKVRALLELVLERIEKHVQERR